MQTALCGKVLVSRNVRNRKTRSILAGLLSLGILFLLSGGLASLPVSAASSLQYHNVQVFLQTQSQDGNMYTLTTYQSNGTLISSTQSQYPAFSLELPSGTYLFAASVVNKSSSYWWSYSTSEYGYQRQQISSDTTINIQTQALQNIPTSKITIETNFVNGTAMSGANVYASVIGMWYWSSMYNDRALLLSNQTSNGVVTLTVPDLPVEVTAWNWIQVNLPSNETTVQKSIGGQVINVTVYWQPMYVGLSGDLFGQADRLRISELHLKTDGPEGKAEALAQMLDCERIGADVEIGETLVRFTPGGPQGRPKLEAEMFV